MPTYTKTTTTTTKTVVTPAKTVTTKETKTGYDLIKKLARAQDDFYQFANGAWLNDPTVVIPKEYPTWGSFMILRDASLKNQVALLQELAVSNESLSVDEEKILAVWNASLGRFRDWQNTKGSYDPIFNALAVLDAHINDVTDVGLARYLADATKAGISTPFQFSPIQSFDDSSKNVLTLSAEGLSLPSRDYYFEENFAAKKDYFIGHLNKVAELVGTSNLVPGFADSVLRFETKLATITMKLDQSREFTKYYTYSTLSTFANSINELNSLDAKQANYGTDNVPAVVADEDKPRIAAFFDALIDALDLRSTMKANFSKSYPDASADEAERFLVFDGDYFRRVFALLFDDANRDDLKAYLQYKVILSAASYTTRELDEEVFDLYARKFRGQAEQQNDEKRTVTLVNDWVAFLLGKVYVSRFFSVEDKARVQSMIDEVTQVMGASIQRNDWLMPVTKTEALAKLAAFKTKIGFPDKWVDYDDLVIAAGDSLWEIKKKMSAFTFKKDLLKEINVPADKSKWFMAPQVVNAYYSGLDNEIVFPAGIVFFLLMLTVTRNLTFPTSIFVIAILAPPFYGKDLPSVTFDINAADRALVNDDGLVLDAINFGGISAVIAHEITHGFDDQGRSFDGAGNLRDWWTEDDTALFKAKCDVMVKQTWTFVDPATGKEHSLNPQLTMGENLADLGGISLSVQALLKRAGSRVQGESRRALLRIFFNSWANVWKTKASDAYLINMLATDPHSPAQVRGNLVKNIDAFYEAYDVKEGDAMYLAPADRVVMW
ncbi:hypothetical protein BC830DRAFT_1209119 [Chytriomyces sp. MP71]|nr:hypothetical protein BC830DRAFT_1209119 [Chytriomyces sp. MP71]